MLTITLSATDDFDAVELNFEHSLVSLSKWEQKYQKPFFSNKNKTAEEAAAYIKCMLLDENIPDDFLNRLSRENITEITEYINDKQSATWFKESSNQKKSNETITSELIYYWLVQFNIPFEVQTWHLNRLMTLVKIAGIKQTKPKPMSKAQQAEEYRRLNAERRAALGTTG
jgi:hypothetical protein